MSSAPSASHSSSRAGTCSLPIGFMATSGSFRSPVTGSVIVSRYARKRSMLRGMSYSSRCAFSSGTNVRCTYKSAPFLLSQGPGPCLEGGRIRLLFAVGGTIVPSVHKPVSSGGSHEAQRVCCCRRGTRPFRGSRGGAGGGNLHRRRQGGERQFRDGRARDDHRGLCRRREDPCHGGGFDRQDKGKQGGRQGWPDRAGHGAQGRSGAHPV